MVTNRKLRIAMLSVHSCPMGRLGARDTGGMNVYIKEISRELGKQEHVVDVYTRIHRRAESQIMELGKNARLVHVRAGVGEVPKLALYSHLSDFACGLENFRKKNDLRYDVIFSHYWLSGQVGEILQGWWGLPHLITFHTLGAVKNTDGIGEDEPELRIETERKLVANCQRIVASADREKDDLIRYYGAQAQKIGIVPCGVNLDLFQPVEQMTARQELGLGDGKIVLFVGRIEPVKGIDRLLEAMTYLLREVKARLLVIGGDRHSRDEVARLRKLSRGLKIQDSVEFLGSVEQEELPRFYSAADVCVVPSYNESFGMVMLESLACGTPVVATDVGGARSVIRRGMTGYVVPDNTPSVLAEKIALALSRPKNGTVDLLRASVRDFRWSNIAEAVAGECRMAQAERGAQVTS